MVGEGAPYEVTNADKSGNTPAYKGLMSGKKNKLTGKPLYKAAPHLKLAHNELEGEDLQELDNLGSKIAIGAATGIVGGGIGLMKKAKEFGNKLKHSTQK